ncbi:MAG: nucleotide pyrophosphohydrolase [Acidimicrobiales bacterium]
MLEFLLAGVARVEQTADVSLDIDNLIGELRTFADEREWDQFHNPKNLAMALAGEVGELLAELQWRSPEDCESENLTGDDRQAVEAELTDVLFYLLRLCDRLDVDLEKAVSAKLAENGRRYPVSVAKGSSAKAPRHT